MLVLINEDEGNTAGDGDADAALMLIMKMLLMMLGSC